MSKYIPINTPYNATRSNNVLGNFSWSVSNSPWINRSFTIFCFMTELFKCKQFTLQKKKKKSASCQIWETETNLTGTAEVCLGRRGGSDSKLIRYILILEIKIIIPSLPLHCPLPFLLGLWLGRLLLLLPSGPELMASSHSTLLPIHLPGFFSHLGLLRTPFSPGTLLASVLLESLIFISWWLYFRRKRVSQWFPFFCYLSWIKFYNSN